MSLVNWPTEDDREDEPLCYCDACRKGFYKSDGFYRLADMFICSLCQGDFEQGISDIKGTS